MGEVRFLLDPWLIGSEIDGFSWLNEQWHTTPSVDLADIPQFSFTVITQSYSDHCHIATLEQLDSTVPILATAKAYNILIKAFPSRTILLIPESEEGLIHDGLRFHSFRPKKILDPVYFALSIRTEQNKGLFYSPHGFVLNSEQSTWIKDMNTEVLITTFSEFQLPSLLGGLVNPGLKNVTQLIRQLNPMNVINTHDEKKRMKGLVSKFAKVQYPDYQKLKEDQSLRFVEINDYTPLNLGE
jgi:hypothetical protein